MEAEEPASIAPPSVGDEEDGEDESDNDGSGDESASSEHSEHEDREDRKGGVRKRKQYEIAPMELKSEPVDKKRSRIEDVSPKAEAPKGLHIFRERSNPGPVAPATVNPGSAVTPPAALELPSTEASMGLLWAIALLRDPTVQQLLQSRLARVLLKISSENSEKLPCDDPQTPILLQLIQLPAIRSNVFAAPDPACLRCLLPAMMAHHLQLACPDLVPGAPSRNSPDFAAVVEKCPATLQGDAVFSVCDRRILNGTMNAVFDFCTKLSSQSKTNVQL